MSEQAAVVSVGTFVVVCAITIIAPQPKTANELIVWLGLGVGLLSLGASISRLAGHRHVRWPGDEVTRRVPAGASEWEVQERRRRAQEEQAELARRAGYDYLGKLLALHAALFALIATGFHLLGLTIE
ncbi:hypothetical protein [Microbacterium paraoxydans]|uniref:hypothetical protein n=1 Tax=Microbacterium paraoxydans TaxID=199592 RepID=UPI001CFBA145|nr:hypothetical protein [Microbacterium paraoxydans]